MNNRLKVTYLVLMRFLRIVNSILALPSFIVQVLSHDVLSDN